MRRQLLAGAAVAVVAAAGLVVTYQAQAGTTGDDPAPDIGLIAPTGDHAVGVTDLHLVDTDRPDPWVPEEPRELMVSMWYPTDQHSGDTAPYLTEDESRLFLADAGVDVPPDTLSRVATHAFPDAKPVRAKHKLPLVVLSPGFSKPRATLTGIAEELASRGYLVAVIGHNYESFTSFPDGHTTECLACGTGQYAKATTGRSADASFVLDRLLSRHSPWSGSRLIDADRVAMGGHSLGGSASYLALREDDRITAALNVDGTIDVLTDVPSDRPLGLIGHEMTETDPTWSAAWELSTGWKHWLMVDGTVHASFTDVGLFLGQMGMSPATIDPERAVALTREYVTAFFDLHLRGAERPVWDGPTAEWPEVSFTEP